MEVRKVVVNNVTMDVISPKEYERRSEFSDPMFEDTCVEMGCQVYPIMKRYDENTVGVYDTGICMKFNKIPEEQKAEFSTDKIIDFDNAKDYADIIRKKDQLNNSELARLTTKNNIYVPSIAEDDSPALKLVKEAVGLKEIDLDSYRPDMGSNFSNWTRLITSPKNKSITVNRVVDLGEALGFDAYLVIKDKPNVPNPIGRTLEVALTSEE